MSTTTIVQRRVNPYFKLSTLITDTIEYVGANMGASPTLDIIISLIGDYVDSIQYNSGNKFEANKIDTYGMAATALNKVYESVDMEMYESDDVDTLLTLPTDYTSNQQIALFQEMETRGFGCSGNLDDLRIILLGTSIGIELANYWETQISLGASSPWDPFISSFEAKWVNEGIRGGIMFSEETDLLGVLTAAAVFSIYNVMEPSL